MSRYRDESLDDAADRLYEEHRQRMTDAYIDGKEVGKMGLGAGLCPQHYSNAEHSEWLRGFAHGAAELLTDRRKAA